MTLNSQLQGNADITDSDIPGPFNRRGASKICLIRLGTVYVSKRDIWTKSILI